MASWCRTIRSSRAGPCTGAGLATPRTLIASRWRYRITAIPCGFATSGSASCRTRRCLHALRGPAPGLIAPVDRLGLRTDSVRVRDLWARAERGTHTRAYRATVPAHGVVLVRITPVGRR